MMIILIREMKLEYSSFYLATCVCITHAYWFSWLN